MYSQTQGSRRRDRAPVSLPWPVDVYWAAVDEVSRGRRLQRSHRWVRARVPLWCQLPPTVGACWAVVPPLTSSVSSPTITGRLPIAIAMPKLQATRTNNSCVPTTWISNMWGCFCTPSSLQNFLQHYLCCNFFPATSFMLQKENKTTKNYVTLPMLQKSFRSITYVAKKRSPKIFLQHDICYKYFPQHNFCYKYFYNSICVANISAASPMIFVGENISITNSIVNKIL